VRRFILTVTAALIAGGCGSTAPTPVPPPPTEDPPKITCPGPQTIPLTGTASSATATYTPTTTNGRPPVTVVCTPPSGSSFGVGQATVNCVATDALQRTNSCSLAITVIAAPKLTVTRFVSFGDSITAGEDGIDGGPDTSGLCQPKVTSSAGIQPQVILPAAQTYPGQLQTQLSARYPAQSPTVLNRGCPGESATGLNTRRRFDAIVSTGQYDVVLILEGSNDLDNAAGADPATQAGVVGSAAAALRLLVGDAKASGVRPLLATIPPMNPAGRRGAGATLVTSLNDRIVQIGSAENMAIVDVYAAFKGDLTLLGDDGLHPNANGYTVIAGAFLQAIENTLEVKTSSLTTSSTRR
jgi:lysophospholipase L1-like esterase